MSNDKTEVLPTVAPVPTRRSILHAASSPSPSPSPFDGWRGQAQTDELPAVSPSPRRRGRVARRTAPTGTKVRHLRAALAGILIAAAVLIPMQLYAAQGISSARQAALAAAMPEQAPSVRTGTQPDWVTEDTHAAYNRTDPSASPLSLPACTTSPDTPLPCLATISPSQTRAVVLEEDASLTALVRR